jgi:carotenoid cleavage dioxygenase
VFHPLNAFEQDGEVVLDAARYPELWRRSAEDFGLARLHRFRIDPAAGRVREEALDERGIEFPRVDPRREGLPHRFGYAVQFDDLLGYASPGLVQYDLARGTTKLHAFGAGRVPGEGVFVPASPRAGEDEGWVISYVYDPARDASELVILDASSFDKPPVASVRLPARVPFGFHGNWIPDPA